VLSGQFYAPVALPQGGEKSPRYPLDGRLGGIQSLSGRYKEKYLLPLPGIEAQFLGRPAQPPRGFEYVI
jgi:hypothetical protein